MKYKYPYINYILLLLFVFVPNLSYADVLGEFYFGTGLERANEEGIPWDPSVKVDICFKAKHVARNKPAICQSRYKLGESIIIAENDLGATFSFNSTNSSSFLEFSKLLSNGKVDPLTIIWGALNTSTNATGSSTGPESSRFFNAIPDSSSLVDFHGYNIESIDVVVSYIQVIDKVDIFGNQVSRSFGFGFNVIVNGY